MRVGNDTDINIMLKAGNAQATGAGRNAKGKKAFFAGNMGQTGNDRYGKMIEHRRKQAQKEIKKLIGDVWEGDTKLDNDIKELRDDAAKRVAENKEMNDVVKDFEEQRAALKEEYRIEDGSEEQKELELLMKEKDDFGHLTMDELNKLGEIHSRGLTDYQAQSLEIYDYEKPYKSDIRDNELAIEENYATVRETKRERLKSDPMLAAQGQAEEIAAAASKDIMGMLKQQSMDHIEEEYEKRIEAAKKKAEEKEEQEELKAEREEKKEQLEEHIEELTQNLAENAVSPETQKEIQEILDKLKLLNEDIKGSKVDANI